MSDKDFKVIYTGVIGQAELIKSVLELENIECYYANESIGTIVPDFHKSIMAREKDFNKALKLINSVGDNSNIADFKFDDIIKDKDQE